MNNDQCKRIHLDGPYCSPRRRVVYRAIKFMRHACAFFFRNAT